MLRALYLNCSLKKGNEPSNTESLMRQSHIGFLIPPNADVYWVGEAGPGPSYMEAGKENAFTIKNTKTMSLNLVHLARLLAEHPIPAAGNTL